jgi:predicted dehydrogenase
MGKHHARTIHEMDDAKLVCVVDTDEAVARAVAGQRDCKVVATPEEAAGMVDCAIIATPTVRHLESARPFVERSKPVLIEKPFTDDVQAGMGFMKLALQKGAAVQIGHTERYNPASLALRRYDIHPKFIEAHRISPYTFRSADVGVVLDVMIHDIDLVLMYARTVNVVDVRAIGVNVIGGTEDICSARLEFDNGCVANITASRLAIKTERKMRIFSEDHYLSVDYGKKVGIVIEKRKNLDLIQMAGEMDVDDIAELAQNVDYTDLLTVEELKGDESVDPLTMQAEDFRRVVQEGMTPPCSASDGLAAVRVADSILEKIHQHRWDGARSSRSGPDIIEKETQS